MVEIDVNEAEGKCQELEVLHRWWWGWQAFRVSHMQDVARHGSAVAYGYIFSHDRMVLQQLGLWSSGMTSS